MNNQKVPSGCCRECKYADWDADGCSCLIDHRSIYNASSFGCNNFKPSKPLTNGDENNHNSRSNMISCKEKLPERDGKYLVYLTCTGEFDIVEFDTELQQFGYTDYYKDEFGTTITEWYEVYNITHWTPLPEKPEEDCDVGCK